MISPFRRGPLHGGVGWGGGQDSQRQVRLDRFMILEDWESL